MKLSSKRKTSTHISTHKCYNVNYQRDKSTQRKTTVKSPVDAESHKYKRRSIYITKYIFYIFHATTSLILYRQKSNETPRGVIFLLDRTNPPKNVGLDEPTIKMLGLTNPP